MANPTWDESEPIDSGSTPTWEDSEPAMLTDVKSGLSSLGDMANAAGRGFLRNFPLAQQAAALGSQVGSMIPGNPLNQHGYSDALKGYTDAAEAAKASNPVSYGVGAVGGALAPALAGQPETLLGAAGAGLLQGAGSATADTSVTQKPRQFATEAGLGGGLGALTGGLSQKYLTPLANKAAAANFGDIAPELIGGTDGTAAMSIPSKIVGAPPTIVPGTPSTIARATLPSISQKTGDIIGSDDLELTEPVVQKLGKFLRANDLVHLAQDPQGVAQDLQQQITKEAMKGSEASVDKLGDLANKLTVVSDLGSLLTKQDTRGFGMAGRLTNAITGGNPLASLGAGAGLAAFGHPLLGIGAASGALANPALLSKTAAVGAPAVGKALSGPAAEQLSDYLRQKYGGQP